jgi:hypothetical protein
MVLFYLPFGRLLTVAVFATATLLGNTCYAAEELESRAEIGVKAGSRRSILTTEFWAPLAQQSDRVVYTDLRLMGDDDDNREGNLGIGYRQIYVPTNSVLGIHGWIDRRRTEHNSTFHQATIGVESLGDKIDARLNGYIPLSDTHTVTTPNLGQSTPYLAGSGIFYDTNGFVKETPQYGLDAELGYRLPILQKQFDTIRLYGGGYHFFRNDMENVTGFRFRTEAQLNKIFSVGARFQHDGARGSQGFLEATIKFPFKAKKLYQEKGLYARLDESPERDVDIVTGSKIDNGLKKPVENTASGEVQRVLYVDNSNSSSGDGTKENPFNSLLTAQENLKPNDILYINRGDGTTRNMDQGITINQPGVHIIGSGSSFVYDSGRFSANNGETYNGLLLQAATTAPVITNTQTSVDNYSGNAVTIFSDNVSVSGITTTNATGRGIAAFADGVAYHTLVIDNVSSNYNKIGIVAYALNGGSFENMTVNNSSANYNNGLGISADLSNSGKISTVIMTNNSGSNNTSALSVAADTSGSVDHVYIDGNTTFDNSNHGVRVATSNLATIDNVEINNGISYGNGNYGTYVVSSLDSVINNIYQSNLTLNNNGASGNYISAFSHGIINSSTVSGVTANGNGQYGTYITASNSSIGAIDWSNITASNNSATGVYIYSNANGITGSVKVNNVIANNNTSTGVYLYAYNTGSYIGTAEINNVTATGNIRGVFLESRNGGIMDKVKYSNILASNNTSYGVNISVYNSGTLNELEMNNITTNNNQITGSFIYAQNVGLINKVTLNNITANNNTQQGLHLSASGGTMNNTTITTGQLNNNGQSGLYLQAVGSSIINGVNASYLTMNNNTGNGFYVNGSSSSSTISNVALSYSNMLNNTGYGAYLVRGNTSGTINIDLGGGAYGSAGQNRIFNNTTKDIRVAYSGTTTNVFVKNNWWNNPAGIQASQYQLTGATLDSSAFLTADPRP